MMASGPDRARRWPLAGVVLAFCLAAGGESTAAVALIRIDGSINPAVAEFIGESIDRARDEGAAALVIELDTPGGLLSSTKTIVKDILGAPVPVIVYVAPSGSSAGSAGVFITMAAHVAAMAPGTNIGAAHPVGGQGETIGGDLGEKIENFTASFSETIAQRRGRNTEWAEKAVRESVSITEREAVEKGVIDLVARDLSDLLGKANGRVVEVESGKTTLALSPADRVIEYEMRLAQRVLNTLADPNIAYLLMMAGLLGLYFEFSHPGTVFPGVAGAICLLLALAAFQVLPINYTGLMLILLGVALLVAELFMPSFGIVGIGGIIAFVLGSLLLFDTPESELMVDRRLVYTIGAVSLTVFLVLAYLVGATFRRPVHLGFEGMIGQRGEVRQRLAPRGKVLVHGEYWNAESEEEIGVGEEVEVMGLRGMRLRVRRIQS